MALFSDEQKARVTHMMVSGDLARTAAKIFHECDANKTTFLELSHGEIRVFVVQVFAILGLDPPHEALIYDIYKRFDTTDRGALDFEECLQLVVLLSNVILGIQKPLKGMVQADVLSRTSTSSSRWSSGHYPPSRGTGRSLSPRSSAYRTASPRTLGNPTGAPMGSMMRAPSPRTLGNRTGLPRTASPSRSGLLSSTEINSRLSTKPPLIDRLSSSTGLPIQMTPSSASIDPRTPVDGLLRQLTTSIGPPPQTAQHYPSRPPSVNADTILSETPPGSLSSTLASSPGSSLTASIRRVDHLSSSLTGLPGKYAARPSILPDGQAEWTADNVIKLATYPRGPFACKVKILPRRVAYDVPTTVDSLNNGSIECAEDFCVAYFEAANSHFLLYKRGKEAEAWEGLDMPRLPVA